MASCSSCPSPGEEGDTGQASEYQMDMSSRKQAPQDRTSPGNKTVALLACQLDEGASSRLRPGGGFHLSEPLLSMATVGGSHLAWTQTVTVKLCSPLANLGELPTLLWFPLSTGHLG